MTIVICDIDGTLALTPKTDSLEEFNKLDHSKFEVNQKVLEYIDSPYVTHVHFLTARDLNRYFNITFDWIKTIKTTYIYNNWELECINHSNLKGKIAEYKAKVVQNIALFYPGEVVFLDDSEENLLEVKNLKLDNVIALHPDDLRSKSKEPKSIESSSDFKKFDSGKLDYSLLEPLCSEMYIEAAECGAKKYGRSNWKRIEVKDVSRIIAAQMRHFESFRKGDFLDKESGQSHLSHALWQLVTLEWCRRKFGDEEIRKYL